MKKTDRIIDKKSKNLTLKVVVGYSLLAVIAFGSIFYILSIIKEMSAVDSMHEQREKKRLITRTISLLNESASIGQPIGMTEEHFELFNETMDESLVSLGELRKVLSDTLHIQGVDTIEMLIENKRLNTIELYSIWNDMNKAKLYDKNIKKIAADTITQVAVKEQVKTQTDSVVIVRQKKGFFKRLADAFIPPKEDVRVVVNRTSDLQTDTIHNVYNQAEIQAIALREYQEKLEKERKRFNFQLYNKAVELRHNDVLINARINLILYAIEEEETASAIENLDDKQQLYKRSTRVLGIVSIIAILIILGSVFVISRDVSRGRYYRIQLEKAKQYAEELLIKQEKFMLAISHDIRAPISSILGYVELLLRRKPDERQRYYLENMISSSNHILSLVNDLLDFHRLDSGKMEIQKVPFNVKYLFEDIFLSFKPIADAKKLDFQMNLDETGTGLTYSGDTIRIRQIVSNLLSNALKFTQKGQVVLSVEVKDSVLNLSVCDTGPGIPEAERYSIFGEFTRLKNEKEEGFGLGLSITHKLIDLMQGSISLESKLGEGSIFLVSIPLAEIEKDSAKTSVARDEDEGAESKLTINKDTVKCLLVDDDPLQLALTKELLSQNQILVETCTDPHEVRSLLENQTYDVIISDIQMPGLDGFELVKQIRASGIKGTDTLPVIALSASVANEEDVYLSAGFTGFLNKPFTAKELISILNDLLSTDFDKDMMLDFSSLTDFAAGDKEALNTILDTFKNETSGNVGLLKAAVEQLDRVQASKIAHKMIPVFVMIGANHLVQRLRLLEKNDGELSDEAWKSLISEVDVQIHSIMEDVSKQMGGE